MYYNTTNTTGQQLKIYTDTAKTQDEIVMGLCKRFKRFSCSTLYKIYPLPNTPITSIRRSLHTLQSMGFIQKTGNKVLSKYNRPECEYENA
jgi:hypothetical protein